MQNAKILNAENLPTQPIIREEMRNAKCEMPGYARFQRAGLRTRAHPQAEHAGSVRTQALHISLLYAGVGRGQDRSILPVRCLSDQLHYEVISIQ
jgi:hypothetical protein